ncbi:MAG: T9SS type A sorting domain-containing protein [Bacteroidota bacterium]
MNLKILIAMIKFSNLPKKRVPTLIFLLLLQFSVTTILFSQSQANISVGSALFLTKEEYNKLPRPNWDTLEKESKSKTIFLVNTSSTKILFNPPIGSQGHQNSCVGWATSTALGILNYQKYYCWEIAQRSPSYIYNQVKILNCTSGAALIDGINLIINQGSSSMRLMPYDINNCSILPNSEQIYDASKNKAYSHFVLDKWDVSGIKNAIDLGDPVVVGFFCNQSFNDMWYKGKGIWKVNYGDPIAGHAACIIGYDDIQKMFKVQNSMGLEAGDKGYFWVTYDLVKDSCFEELYILSGINSKNSETISGPAIVCFSDATFTLENPPLGCTISWDNSPNLRLLSASGNKAVFSAVSKETNDQGWVKAIINSCSFTIPKRDVWVGIPQLTNQMVDGNSYYPGMQICPGSHLLSIDPKGSNTVATNWTVPTGIQYTKGINSLNFNLPTSTSRVIISGTSNNMCDNNSNFSFDLFNININNSDSIKMTLYPNPASDNVTITILESPSNNEPIVYSINIYDRQSILLSSMTRSGQSFNIPLVNMRDGTYIIEVSAGSHYYHQQLIVKHN